MWYVVSALVVLFVLVYGRKAMANMVNKQTIKGSWQTTAANQTYEVLAGTQLTPTPGPPAIGAMLQVWLSTDFTQAEVDIVVGSTQVGAALKPNYRAEETGDEGTPAGSTFLDFAGIRINEDQVIADQAIGPSTPISITFKSGAATTGYIHYLIVMEPMYASGPASA